MVLSRREKILFILASVIIILSSLYSFVFKPFYKQSTSLDREIDIKCLQLAGNSRTIKERDAAREELNQYSPWFTFRGSQEEEVALILGEIEKLGKASGIYLSEVIPQGIKNTGLYKSVSVEIKFKATINNLTKFIYSIEDSLFFLRIDSLQLNCKNEDKSLLEGNIIIDRLCL